MQQDSQVPGSESNLRQNWVEEDREGADSKQPQRSEVETERREAQCGATAYLPPS